MALPVAAVPAGAPDGAPKLVASTPPGPAEGQQEVQFAGLDIDYSMDPGADEGADEGTGDPGQPGQPTLGDGASDSGAPAPDPATEALLARIARAERDNAELRDMVSRLPRTPQQDELSETPPVDPANIKTAQEMLKYLDWQRAHDRKELMVESRIEAEAASSEQRARGLLNPGAVGVGYDYDSMIAKYILPLERDSAATKRLFAMQRDPALARYTIATMLELTEKMGGDPVKAFTELRQALSGRKQAGKELVEKVQEGARKVAVMQRAKAGKQGQRQGGKLTARNIEDMPIKEFLKLRESKLGPML